MLDVQGTVSYKEQMGLDGQLRSTSSIFYRVPPIVNSLEFERQNLVQVSRIKSSRIGLGTRAIKYSGNQTGTFAFSSGTIFDVKSSIRWDSPKQDQPVMAIPYTAFFEGTVLDTAHCIWPVRGTSVTWDKYRVSASMDALNATGTKSAWGCNIWATAGTASQVVTFLVNWQFFDHTAAGVI